MTTLMRRCLLSAGSGRRCRAAVLSSSSASSCLSCPQALHSRPVLTRSLTSSASSPLVITSLYIPQLSPSMKSATITSFHAAPRTTVSTATLLFTLSTSSLLESPSSSSPASMLVETHDPGFIARLDRQLQGRELEVGSVIGWMWEDEDDERRGKDRLQEIEEMLSRGEDRRDGIRIRPFLWQAYTGND